MYVSLASITLLAINKPEIGTLMHATLIPYTYLYMHHKINKFPLIWHASRSKNAETCWCKCVCLPKIRTLFIHCVTVSLATPIALLGECYSWNDNSLKLATRATAFRFRKIYWKSKGSVLGNMSYRNVLFLESTFILGFNHFFDQHIAISLEIAHICYPCNYSRQSTINADFYYLDERWGFFVVAESLKMEFVK